MNCQEWELKLAEDEAGPEVEAHLAECADCRALAEELAANSEAMRGLGEEAMPPAALPSPAPSRWRWASAIAAMLVAGIGLWHLYGPGPVRTPTTTVTVRPMAEAPKPTVEPPLPVIAQARSRGPRRVVRSSWQLVSFSETEADDDSGPVTQALVRRATSDPDVVIYWLIETKKEELE
jgi:hypothetical protein